jgi:hypothetical protein
MYNVEVLLDKLTRAISYRYKDDKTAPGLTVSVLKKGYYCSVVRYQGAFAKDKVVAFKARGETLAEALNDLTTQFLKSDMVPTNPVEELRNFVRANTMCPRDVLGVD